MADGPPRLSANRYSLLGCFPRLTCEKSQSRLSPVSPVVIGPMGDSSRILSLTSTGGEAMRDTIVRSHSNRVQTA